MLILAKKDIKDSTSAENNSGSAYKNLNKDIKGVKIGLPKQCFNALDKEDVEEITLEEGYAKVIVKSGTRNVEVLNVMIIQLQTIQESYPKFIKIK